MEPCQPGHIGCRGEASGHRLEKEPPPILLDSSHLPTEFYSGGTLLPQGRGMVGELNGFILVYKLIYASRPEVTGASVHAGWSGRS